MHSRILHRLTAAESGLDTAVGSYCLSYTSDKENSLDNLIICGSASAYSGPLGEQNTETGYYEMNVRIHGRNLLGGEEFYSLMTQRYSSYINHSRNGDLFEFSYTYVPSYMNIFGSAPRMFKKNTVYTFRFHFIGGKGKSTGIQIVYEDGCCEDILAGDTNECDIAYTSAPGKTIDWIKLSDIGTNGFIIDLSTFGIFEGEVGYDDFEPYAGNVYTLSTSSCYCGQDDDVPCYDSFEWKTKISTQRLRRIMVDKSRIYPSETHATPMILDVTLPTPINMKRPSLVFHTYKKKDSFDEIVGVEYAYAIVDEDTVALSLYKGIYNFTMEFNNPRALIYARETALYVKEDMCIDIPDVPSGYVGIEVWSNISPKKLIAHYKK